MVAKSTLREGMVFLEKCFFAMNISIKHKSENYALLKRELKTSELANQTMEFLGHGFVKMESWEYF